MDKKKYLNETGKIYGNLFTNYNDELFEKSVNLFLMRHKKWGMDMDWFKDKICLDAGCGGGRFMVALSKLGAGKVRGIDISEDAVKAANERLASRNFIQSSARQASVLDIPYPDSYFDYIVCSGVLHHTPDPYKGFLELTRVLKPGGKLFLSVYGKWGLKWFINDIFRYSLCKIIPFSIMEKILKFLRVPANVRYAKLDNLYVPYCFRYTEKEIRNWLTNNGFTNLRRVKFERYDYEKFKSKLIYGVGWIQFYADKK